MAEIQRIDFYGHALESWEDTTTGKVYVAMRLLCQSIGLNWTGQQQKLVNGHTYKVGVRRIDISTPGGKQQVIGLDLDFLPTWLFSISPEKVAPDIRETLTLFQQESVKALRDYWTKGYAARKDPVAQFPELRAIRELITATAESKIEAQLARQEAAEAKQEALDAHTKAETAMHGQAWMTIHQYVTVHKLEEKFPESHYAAYAKHLTIYCLENGFRIYPQPVSHQRWEDEQAYYVQAIHDTLPQWLYRRYAQITMVPHDDTSGTRDPGVKYISKKKRG